MSESAPSVPGVPAGAAPATPTFRPSTNPLFDYLLRLGDDRLVLGHRLSEWCGHAPILEEDIALANIALDLIGQATAFLRLAGEVEGKGRDEDALAFFREAIDFRNVHLVELPRGDFAFTIVRQFLFDTFAVLQLDALQRSAHAEVAALAAKSLKEAKYHIRHSAEWMIKLGDGTSESRRRMQRALDELWAYSGELFLADGVDAAMVEQGVGVDLETLRAPWQSRVDEVLAAATLRAPTDTFTARGGRQGRHSEHLGHMLAEMQIVARSHPGATW
jgi:ring-1,2-phenylacetyl-CoA epoxidase subunit PaaC